MKASIAILLVFVAGLSCYPPYRDSPYWINQVGYKAVYSNDPDLKKVTLLAAKEMNKPGKIYVKDNMILQNDIGSGIHIYDASTPSDLKKIGFIQIAGNVELSIKGNHLYANSFADLVVIDLRSWTDARELRRIPNVFFSRMQNGMPNSFIPMPETQFYYECVDLTKGTHIGWEKDTLRNECAFYHF